MADDDQRAGPWIESIIGGYKKIKKLVLKRMLVTDADVQILADKMGRLKVLKFRKCVGFSTNGLKFTAGSCKNLTAFLLEDRQVKRQSGWLDVFARNNTVLECFKNLLYMKSDEIISDDQVVELARATPLVSFKTSHVMRCHTLFFGVAVKLDEFVGYNEEGIDFS